MNIKLFCRPISIWAAKYRFQAKQGVASGAYEVGT